MNTIRNFKYRLSILRKRMSRRDYRAYIKSREYLEALVCVDGLGDNVRSAIFQRLLPHYAEARAKLSYKQQEMNI